MRCSPQTFLSFCLLALLSACSADIKKVALGSSCRSNTDCVGNNICYQDRCVARVDCNQDENIYLPQCPGRGCKIDTDCPDGFCDPATRKCASGARPSCEGSDDACATSADGTRCLTDADGNSSCVECIDDADCPSAGGKQFACDSTTHACAEIPARGTCESKAQCTTDPTKPVCNTKKKECVGCLTNNDCKGANAGKVCDNAGTDATFTCIDKTVIDCRQTGCTDSTKICDATTGLCRACTAADDCGAGRHCEIPAAGTSGQCVPDGGTNNECNADTDCTKDATGAAMPAGYNRVCKKAQTPFVCADCVTDGECSVAGTICADFGTIPGTNKVCGPTPVTNTCTVGNDCTNAHDACVNGVCSATCQNSGQCHTGDSCDNTGHCVPTTATCPATPCTGGLVCVAGACVNCTNNGQCPAGQECQNGLCDDPQPQGSPRSLGAICAVDSDCDSNLCREFTNISGAGPAKIKVCTAVCARTNTSGATAEDCPTSPATALTTADRGVTGSGYPALAANKGYACAPFINSTLGGFKFDGTSLCLHADDFGRVAGVTFAANAFTALPNAAPGPFAGCTTGNDCNSKTPICQSNIALNTGGFTTTSPNANSVCAAGCQSTADCKATTQFPDYVCGAELVTARLTSNTCTTDAQCASDEFCDTDATTAVCTKLYSLPSGRNACQEPGDYQLEGRFCRHLDEDFTWPGACQSSFCAGRCLTLATATATTCSADADCPGGHFCDTSAGTCAKSTEFKVNATTCTTDAQCGAGNVCHLKQCYKATCDLNADCPAGAICMNSKCHATSALTTSLCQDDFECGNNQACGGRCALFCDDRSTCTDASSNLRDKVNVVCGYWPGQPTRSGMNQRICRARATATTGINHTQQRGQVCNADTECVTEVCDSGKCTDFCGRADTCLANETCKLRPHATVPNGTQVLSPICVPN